MTQNEESMWERIFSYANMQRALQQVKANREDEIARRRTAQLEAQTAATLSRRKAPPDPDSQAAFREYTQRLKQQRDEAKVEA